MKELFKKLKDYQAEKNEGILFNCYIYELLMILITIYKYKYLNYLKIN